MAPLWDLGVGGDGTPAAPAPPPRLRLLTAYEQEIIRAKWAE